MQRAMLYAGVALGLVSAPELAYSQDVNSGVKIQLKTQANGNYYLNCNDSNGPVQAVKKEKNDPARDETFTIEKVGGGALKHGDLVTLRTATGWYLNAHDSTGAVKAVEKKDGPARDETFIVVRKAGAGNVRDGDAIFFKTQANGNYYLNCNDSNGSVQAVEKKKNDPARDEMFTLRRVGR